MSSYSFSAGVHGCSAVCSFNMAQKDLNMHQLLVIPHAWITLPTLTPLANFRN